jgi:hypothetical protein
MYGGDDNERWIRIEMVFDWANGDVTFNVEYVNHSASASETLSMINGVDIERLDFRTYDNESGEQGWDISRQADIYLDAIQAFDGNDGWYDDFEDGTLQGWSDPTGYFTTHTNPAGVDVDQSLFPASVTVSKDTFSLRERAPSVENSLQFDYTGDVFSFTPSGLGPSVTDPDGPDLVAFDTWVAATRGHEEATLSDAGALRPSWMTAILTKNVGSPDGSANGTVRFSFEKGEMPAALEVLRIGCYIEDGAGQSKTAYFDYWPERDLVLSGVMGQEDKYRPDAKGGGHARAVVTPSEESVVAIYWGPYKGDATTKADLARRVPFSSLDDKHEILWSGLSVDATYGFYVEALTPHGQTVESGIYRFTTGDTIRVTGSNLHVSFVESWKKELTVELLPGVESHLSTSSRSEFESASVDTNLEMSIFSGSEKQMADTVRVNDFDSNINTSTDHTIN